MNRYSTTSLPRAGPRVEVPEAFSTEVVIHGICRVAVEQQRRVGFPHALEEIGVAAQGAPGRVVRQHALTHVCRVSVRHGDVAKEGGNDRPV